MKKVEIKIPSQLIKFRAEMAQKQERYDKLGKELEELRQNVTRMENDKMLEILRTHDIALEDLAEFIPFWLEMRSDEQKTETEKPTEDTTQW